MILTLSASCTMLSSRSRVLRSSSYRRGVALKIAILSEGAQLQGRRQERTSHLQHRHGTLRSATTFERVSLSVLHLQYRQTSGCCLFAHTCNVPLVRIQAGVDEALSCSSDHVSVATDFSSLRTRRTRLIRSWVSCSACISSAHEEAIEGMGKYAERTTSLQRALPQQRHAFRHEPGAYVDLYFTGSDAVDSLPLRIDRLFLISALEHLCRHLLLPLRLI